MGRVHKTSGKGTTMDIKKLALIITLTGVIALGLAVGCEKKGEPPAEEPPATTEGATKLPAPVPPKVRQDVLEAARQLPREAMAWGVLRSPKALVDGLNGFLGPELATAAAFPFSALPAGAVDMESPVAWAATMGPAGPGVVILMKVADADALKGPPLEDGISMVPLALPKGPPPMCVMQRGDWAAFSFAPHPLRSLRDSTDTFRLDEATADRLSGGVAWIQINAETLAALAKPMLKQVRSELEQRPREAVAEQLDLIDWADDVLGQVETFELVADPGDAGLVMRTAVTLREGGSLLEMARTLKPLETYDMALPPTDRVVVAGWARVDAAALAPKVREFVDPLATFFFAMLSEMQGRKGPEAQIARDLREPIREVLDLAETFGPALGDQYGYVMELPEPDEGFYRVTQTAALKDAAAYASGLREYSVAFDDLLKALLGAVPRGAGAEFDMGMEFEPSAETIEEVPVDVMRFRFEMEPPPDAPPHVREMLRNPMASFYGPDGLVWRSAIVEKRAVATMGGKDVMAEAIRNARRGGELAEQPAVAAALRRVPEGSSAVYLISTPAYAYLMGQTYEGMFRAMIPDEARASIEAAPLPEIDRPTLGEPAVAAVRVEGRTVQIDVTVPASEIAATVPIVRHAWSRMMYFWGHASLQMMGRMQQPRPGGGPPPTVPQPSMQPPEPGPSHESSSPIEEGDETPAPSVGIGDPAGYTCTMHPQIALPRRGKCPICGMDMVPRAAVEEDVQQP